MMDSFAKPNLCPLNFSGRLRSQLRQYDHNLSARCNDRVGEQEHVIYTT